MKKSFLMLGVAVLAALVSCKKEEVPADVLEIIAAPTETTIAKEGTDTPLTLTFKSTKAWTASTDAEFVTVTPKSGDPADECKIKINVAENTTETDRAFTVTIKSEGLTPLTLNFTQASQFHMNIDPLEFSATKDGGEFTINVDANVEFKVTDYSDGSFPWQHAVPANDGKTYKVTIDANTGYDPRTSYVKFKTSEIQVPVIDEETGEPTSEMEDLTIRVYFYQEGNLAQVWRQEFTWTQYSGCGYSMATSGDYIVVNTSAGLQIFNKADGAYVNTIATDPYVLTGITNDDAGNIVVSMGGDYPLNEDWSLNEEAQIPLTVAYLPAGSTDMASATILIPSYKDEFYGYGLDNIRVTGDVTGDACITMFSGGGAEGHLVFWDVKGGVCENNPTDYVTYGGDAWGEGLPDGIWSSRHCVGKSLGTATGTGVFGIGYDGNYNLFYNATTSMVNWQMVMETGSTWAEGYNCIDYIDWNGHKYAGLIGMSYFAYADWEYDGVVDGYMPCYLWLINIDDPTAPVVVSKSEYYADPDNFCYGSTTDICLELEGDDLVAYIWDSSASCYAKVKYPKL